MDSRLWKIATDLADDQEQAEAIYAALMAERKRRAKELQNPCRRENR